MAIPALDTIYRERITNPLVMHELSELRMLDVNTYRRSMGISHELPAVAMHGLLLFGRQAKPKAYCQPWVISPKFHGRTSIIGGRHGFAADEIVGLHSEGYNLSVDGSAASPITPRAWGTYILRTSGGFEVLPVEMRTLDTDEHDPSALLSEAELEALAYATESDQVMSDHTIYVQIRRRRLRVAMGQVVSME